MHAFKDMGALLQTERKRVQLEVDDEFKLSQELAPNSLLEPTNTRHQIWIAINDHQQY